jgi:hypothetical protein
MALGEPSRAATLCDLAFKSRDTIDDFPAIARKHIEIEGENGREIERMRELYRRLLSVASEDHRVYIDFSEFEFTDGGSIDRACAILEEALEVLPDELKTERQEVKKKLSDILQDRRDDLDI